jgi:Lar family restriction alleviation protein
VTDTTFKPCPFCGGTKVFLRDDDPHHMWVECDDCQIGTHDIDCSDEHRGDSVAAARDLIARWNRRANG